MNPDSAGVAVVAFAAGGTVEALGAVGAGGAVDAAATAGPAFPAGRTGPAGRFEGSRDDRPLLGYDTPTGLTCPYTTPLDVTPRR
nr:hypothetical protein [Mycobacterium tuberculosis]